MMYHTTYESPLGAILLTGTDSHLTGLYFVGQKREQPVPPGSVESAAPFAAVLEQLRSYFAGTLDRFDVPVEFNGTAFQQTVWRALQTIPKGRTWTYTQLAQSIGKPSAVRAVALANACNRISIIVPCHRVIGANGSLTGYAGGLERKLKLLTLESEGALQLGE